MQHVGLRVQACPVQDGELVLQALSAAQHAGVHTAVACWQGAGPVGLHMCAWLTLGDGQACTLRQQAPSDVAMFQAEAWVAAAAVEKDAYKCNPE